jgi:hypothetical protein
LRGGVFNLFVLFELFKALIGLLHREMNNDNDDSILIPFKYSKIGNITSIFILRNAIRCYRNNEKMIGILLVLCYIFTNLHWFNLKKSGIIRNIDIGIVVSIFVIGSYRAFQYDCFARYYLCSCVTVLGFLCNEHMNSLNLYNSGFKYMSADMKNRIYIRSVIVHVGLLHIFQMENGGNVAEYCNLIRNY